MPIEITAIRHLSIVTIATLVAACGGGAGDSAPSASTTGNTQTGTVTAPSILVQPASTTVSPGQSAALSVGASGTDLTYQWLLNATPISGATSSSYTTPAGVAGVASNYTVLISNSGGSVTSNIATVTVSASTVAGVNGAPRLSIGDGWVLAVRADGRVLSWGSGMVGGAGSLIDGTAARLMDGVSNASGVNASNFISYMYKQSLVVGNDGSVSGWGTAGMGALGRKGSSRSEVFTSPVQVSQWSGVKNFLRCNIGGVIALKGDGTVWVMPQSEGFTPAQDPATIVPLQIAGLSNITQLEGNGANHDRTDALCYAIAIDADGAAYNVAVTVANNTSTGTYDKSSVVTKLNLGLPPINRMACQGTNITTGNSTLACLALDKSGNVWSWGYNATGLLGDGTGNNRVVPAQIAGLSNVVSIENYYAAFALSQDGRLFSWGHKNYIGRSSNASTALNYDPTPATVSGLGTVKEFVTGSLLGTFVARLADGTVWGWGSNDAGQLGNGNTADATRPVQAMGINLN